MVYDTIGWDVEYDRRTQSWPRPVVDVQLDNWIPVIVSRFEELCHYGFKQPLTSLKLKSPYVVIINDLRPSKRSQLNMSDYEALACERVGEIVGVRPAKVIVLGPKSKLDIFQLRI